jgi:hypothetical protein
MFSIALLFTSCNHAMNLLPNIVGAIKNRRTPAYYLVLRQLPKRIMESCCCFYDLEVPNYVFVAIVVKCWFGLFTSC